MTTKATRDVIDLKVRPIDFNEGDGLKVIGDCGSDFALDGVPIGLTTPCDAGFDNITVSGGVDMGGNDIDMGGGAVLNAAAGSGPAGETWITETVSDARDADTLQTANNFAEALVGQAIPTGVVIPFAGTTAPSGWLLCAGQEVNRVTFARLFDVVGITYGPGDGATTFNVPDLRGRVAAGVDTMGGTPANRMHQPWAASLSGTGGASQTPYQFPYSGNATYTSSTSPPSNQDSEGPGAFNGAADNHTHTFSVNFAWSGLTDITNVSQTQPTIMLNYIIRA